MLKIASRPDRVRVGLERAAEDDEPPAEAPRDLGVDLVAGELRRLGVGGGDLRGVHVVRRAAVDDEER
jgi:hypothetical protein